MLFHLSAIIPIVLIIINEVMRRCLLVCNTFLKFIGKYSTNPNESISVKKKYSLPVWNFGKTTNEISLDVRKIFVWENKHKNIMNVQIYIQLSNKLRKIAVGVL